MTDEPEHDDVEYTDIGHGVRIAFAGWHPDRELNPQYEHMPDVDRYGLIIEHPVAGGGECRSFATLDQPVVQQLEPGKPVWTVESWEPLTLSPSILCRACGHHGFIQDGRWVPA